MGTNRRIRWVLAGAILGLAPLIAAFAFYSRKPTPSKTCPEALLQLDDAITVWAELNNKRSLDVPRLEDLGRQFQGGKAPVCPEGGTLKLGTSSLATVCSIHGHAKDLRGSHKGKTSQYFERIKELNPLRARVTAARNSCIANLKQIDGAKQQWALENKKRLADVPTASDIAAYLKGNQLPHCSEMGGGKYILKAVGENPECTKVPHKL